MRFARALALIIAFVACLQMGTAQAQVPDCEHMYGQITAEPETIDLGGSSTLRWSLDGGNDCPLWVNGQSVSRFGTLVVQPQTRTTYVLTTSKLDGGRRTLDEVTVTLRQDCATSISGYLSALPRTVHLGGKSALTWYVQAPDSCQLGLSINGVPVGRSGRLFVQPNVTTVYTLVSSIPGAPAIPPATVNVNPKTVYILGNGQWWIDLLVQSVGEDGTTVILGDNVNMNLTGLGPIYIRESVTLTGQVGPTVGRNPNRLGPRLYTTSRPKPLFLIQCNYDSTIVGDNVRISGFRLHGPHYETMDGNSNLENGISIESCLNIEIDNMELAGWSGQAIYVGENPANPRMFNPDAVNIHDNFIHHNQHRGGNGYGVVVSDGAYARIQRNVFDFNRHAIAASGKAGVGYHAESNLVLKGGGVHGKIYNSFTHQFDVHGDQNCPPISGSIWNCGNAGDQFWFYNNSFQYTRDLALKLRGTPRVAAYISGNIFAHGDLDDAVEPTRRTRVHFGSGNVTGFDSYGQYGVCDFNGDGKDDLFLATGKTWWYSSAGKMHWVFLKAATDRLDKVGLGDFNGDGRCDVLGANGNKWRISSGGSGAWTTLPGTYSIPFNQLRFADFNGDRRTDVFRRAPNGQWSVVSPGVHGWRNLSSSSFQLSQLAFGDFTGDGIADVLGPSGGRWSISRSGTRGWARINPNLSTDLKTVLIADVDGNKTDDVVRFRVTSASKGVWEVSWGGRTNWVALKTVSVAPPPAPPFRPLVGLRIFVGQFDGGRGDDLLHVDYSRQGRLYSHPSRALTTYNLFPY